MTTRPGEDSSPAPAWHAAASGRAGIAAAAGASAACVALLLAFTDLKTEGTALYRDPGWDRHIYRLMAERGLFDVRLAPYCWRVLVPAIAGWSPFRLQWSFFAITLAALLATGPVLFAVVRARGHETIAALTTVSLFYSLGWGPKFILADFWIPDGVALLLVALILWAAVRQRLVWFAILLAVGAPTKESVLLTAPTYICLNLRRPLAAQELSQQVIGVLPAVSLVVLLRLLVPHHNGDAAYLATLPGDIARFPELYAHYDYRRLFDEIAVEQRWHDRSMDALLNYSLRPFGVALPVLALLGLRRSWRLALGLAPFFVLTYAQLLFATDTQRLIVLAGPAMALLAADGIAELELRGVSPLVSLATSVALFALALPGAQTYNPPLLAQGVVLVGAACVAALILARSRKQAELPPNPH